MIDYLVTLVLRSVEEINCSLEQKLPLELKEDCPLFSSKGTLDSISLVSLIVDLEQRIENAFEVTIILANEKAMSQRNSPFLTVGTLAKYCEQLISEEKSL